MTEKNSDEDVRQKTGSTYGMTDEVVTALVEATDAYFDGDLERADDAAKAALGAIRRAKAGEKT